MQIPVKVSGDLPQNLVLTQWLFLTKRRLLKSWANECHTNSLKAISSNAVKFAIGACGQQEPSAFESHCYTSWKVASVWQSKTIFPMTGFWWSAKADAKTSASTLWSLELVLVAKGTIHFWISLLHVWKVISVWQLKTIFPMAGCWRSAKDDNANYSVDFAHLA